MKKLKTAGLYGAVATFGIVASLRVQAADDMTVNVGGRIQIDTAFYDDDDVELGDGTEFRRARIFADGTVDSAWKYKLQLDFADNDIDMKDAWILHSSGVMIGQFKQPFSLESLTSSKYMTFMERSMVVDTFSPGRKIGVGWGTEGEDWVFRAGIHGQNADDQAGSADEGWGAAVRGTWAPIKSDEQVLHLGAAFAVEEPSNGSTNSVRYRARPESHVTSRRLVNTGFIDDVDYQLKYGLEAAWVWNSFSLQGEYIANTIECDDVCNSLDTGPLSDDSYDFNGWYAYASYITGGFQRSYKHGTFGRTKAKNAWEFSARWSNLDLSDGDVDGGEQDNYSLGITYYHSPYLRFMFNYIGVDEVDGGSFDGEEPSVFQFRAAVDFK